LEEKKNEILMMILAPLLACRLALGVILLFGAAD